MTEYNPKEHLLADLLLLLNIVILFLLVYERQNFNFIILNPISFSILGIIFWRTRRVYAPSNRITYCLIEGRPAQLTGIFFIILGIVFLIVLNLLDIYSEKIMLYVLVIEFLIGPLILMLMSIFYGKAVTFPARRRL